VRGPSRPIAVFKVKHQRRSVRVVSLSTIRVTIFSGISGNLEMSGNLAKVGDRSGNSCSQGNLIVAAQQNNLPVLYSYCNSFSYVMFA